jgi:hypothetical protein
MSKATPARGPSGEGRGRTPEPARAAHSRGKVSDDDDDDDVDEVEEEEEREKDEEEDDNLHWVSRRGVRLVRGSLLTLERPRLLPHPRALTRVGAPRVFRPLRSSGCTRRRSCNASATRRPGSERSTPRPGNWRVS